MTQPERPESDCQRLSAALTSCTYIAYARMYDVASKLQAHVHNVHAEMTGRTAVDIQAFLIDEFSMDSDTKTLIYQRFGSCQADFVVVEYVAAGDLFQTAVTYNVDSGEVDPDMWWGGEALAAEQLLFSMQNHGSTIRQSAGDKADGLVHFLDCVNYGIVRHEPDLNTEGFVVQHFPPQSLLETVQRETFDRWGSTVHVVGISREDIEKAAMGNNFSW